MNNIPILLAIIGSVLLICEIRSFRFVRRAVKQGWLSPQWRRRRNIAFLVGGLLVVTSQWQHYPLNDGTVTGIPFFAAWQDVKGRDFAGIITIPALLGDLAFWFLVPQLALAYSARRQLNSQDKANMDGT